MLTSVPPPTAGAVATGPALPRYIPDPARFAVLLNRNARQVSSRMVKRVEHIVGRDHVYYSRSLEEADALCREIVQRGYGTVACGGGDGTLMNTVNRVHRYVSQSNAWRAERFARYGERQALLTAPRFAFLPLGTGNAMSGVVGATSALEDLQRIVDYAPGRTYSLDLIDEGSEMFSFGGLGYDSMLLNDYNHLKDRTRHRLLKPWVQGLSGYVLAAALRTLPRLLWHRPRLEARVTTRGPAWYLDPRRGDSAVPVEAGATLYEGRATFIGASTSPFFGYGLKMFPFAGHHEGRLHLRIASIGPVSAVSHLRGIWKGHYRHRRRVLDFYAQDVQIELAQPFPFQHSGDAKGEREGLSLKMASDRLRLVDCFPPRPHG